MTFAFITFEGGEGAGKTTLIDKVYKALSSRSLDVIKTRAPGDTRVGDAIRNLLLYHKDISLVPRCELFLFLADRAQHVDEVIVPALKSGHIVLCDRFNDSTEAYQGAARHLDEKRVRDLCHFASDHLQPDLTIYLDVDPQTGLNRAKKTGAVDKIEAEKITFHKEIREAFHRIAKREPKRFHILDASKSPEHVFNEAMRLIDALLAPSR